MNQQEFNALSIDLNRIFQLIPQNWGAIQNDRFDANVNIFVIDSFSALELAIANLEDRVKNYFRRRWFLWECSKCDEYLFYSKEGVIHNDNPMDQDWDVEFFGRFNHRFDIKGTVIPKMFRNDVQGTIANPIPMLNFFYDKQSRGVRLKYQNRIFLVHHSYIDDNRELNLRINFDFKDQMVTDYVNRLRNANYAFFNVHNVLSDVLYIFENRDHSMTYQFASSALNQR